MTNELADNTRKQVLTLLRQGKSASLVASMLNLSYKDVLAVKKSHNIE